MIELIIEYRVKITKNDRKIKKKIYCVLTITFKINNNMFFILHNYILKY